MESTTAGLSYMNIFHHVPTPCLVLDIDAPVYTIIEVNDAYLKATSTTREKILGTSVFSSFPRNPDDLTSRNIEQVTASFETVMRTGHPHIMSN